MELRTESRYRRRRFRIPYWLLGLLVLVSISVYNRRDMLRDNAIPLLPSPTATPNAFAALTAARIAEDQGALSEAIDAYAQVASIEVSNPDPLVAQSRLYLLKEDVPNALATAQAAYERDPRDPHALNALSRALDWAGEYESAVDIAVEALVIAPDNSETLAILGEIYADVGNWSLSAFYLDRALELDPDNVLAWRNYALLYERQGGYEEGLAALDQGLSIDPAAWHLEVSKGRLYEAILEWEQAVAAYTRARDMNPNVSLTWDALGFAHYKVGNDLEALRVLKTAVEVDPEDWRAQAHLGTTYYRLRNYEQAVITLRRAVEELGDRARIEYLYQLGLAYIYKEPAECDEATPWLLAALAIDPDSGPALQGLALCPA